MICLQQSLAVHGTFMGSIDLIGVLQQRLATRLATKSDIAVKDEYHGGLTYDRRLPHLATLA